jgi:cell volume regulation protein A
MSVTLTLAFILLINSPSTSPAGIFLFLFKQFFIGAVIGLSVSFISVYLLKKFIKLDYEGVYSVLTMGLIIFSYSLTDSLGGNPFLAVYILGLYLGNSDILYKRNLLRYHDNISWLSQIVMFLFLGLLIYPSQILKASIMGISATFFLILVARPLSVFISLIFPPRFNFREKILISWVGLRGAAPIILSTFPLLAGIRGSYDMFYIVFFIVIASVLLQGTSITFMAKFLKLYDRAKSNIKYPIEFEKSDKIEGELNEIEVPPNSNIAGKAIRDLNIPEKILIILIYRAGKFFPVNGKTIIYPNDRLLVLAPISDFLTFSVNVLSENGV